MHLLFLTPFQVAHSLFWGIFGDRLSVHCTQGGGCDGGSRGGDGGGDSEGGSEGGEGGESGGEGGEGGGDGSNRQIILSPVTCAPPDPRLKWIRPLPDDSKQP